MKRVEVIILKERHIQLLKFLLYSSTPKPIDSLMDKWSVSERTIKYDLSTIRKELKTIDIKLLNKKGKGYYFSPEDKPKLVKYYSLPVLDTTKETVQNDIILYTLFVSNPATLTDLSNELFYDESSIRRFIEEIEISNNLIHLSILDNLIVQLDGPEIEIRKLYVEIIQEKLKAITGIELSARLKRVFPIYADRFETKWIKKSEETVQKVIQDKRIWISEKSFEYLLLFIYISYLRRNINFECHDTTNSSHVMIEKFKGEYNFARDLLKQLYWGKVQEGEILYLVQIMIENNIFSDGLLDENTEEKLSQTIGQMMELLAKQYPSFEFHRDDLVRDLRPHLRQIIRKTKIGGTFQPNPLFYQVKQKYNKHYQIAQTIYYKFSTIFNIEYSDNEASLIAIYLYKNTIYEEDKQYSAYLVCGTGRGFSKLLETRIGNIFPNITILERLSSFHLLNKHKVSNADLIISTIELPEQLIPVVKISSFLGRKDIQLINQVLDYGTSSPSLLIDRTDQNHPISLIGKEHDLKDHEISINQENASVFSNILLDLYTFMVDLPEEYNINQEKLLGISIHLTIALPRYFDTENNLEDDEIIDEVLAIEKKHPILAKEMDIFLNTIENSIGKGISYIERYALYQYIIN